VSTSTAAAAAARLPPPPPAPGSAALQASLTRGSGNSYVNLNTASLDAALAATLRAVAEQGADALHRGPIAGDIANATKQGWYGQVVNVLSPL
jgi:gamma-glutamyltranspeptidase/glutathione hydrolase